MRKISNVLFYGGKNMNLCFLHLDSLLVKYWFTNETKMIVSLMIILINLRRCRLQLNNF
jgi:hypothetical protein